MIVNIRTVSKMLQVLQETENIFEGGSWNTWYEELESRIRDNYKNPF